MERLYTFEIPVVVQIYAKSEQEARQAVVHSNGNWWDWKVAGSIEVGSFEQIPRLISVD
jgi:hypothetical protein